MRSSIVVTACLLAVLCAGFATSAENDAAVRAYRSPDENPVPRRVGGSSRGVPPNLPAVAALVPDHLGLTVTAQPTLFWHISAPTDHRIEVTLIEPGKEEPLLNLAVNGTRAGVQRIDLAQHDVRLSPGVEYEWAVALIVRPDQRSRDFVSGGAIMLVSRPALSATTARAYAAAGFWYDALMAFEREELASPSDALPRAQRAALLDEAGLTEVADAERRQWR